MFVAVVKQPLAKSHSTPPVTYFYIGAGILLVLVLHFFGNRTRKGKTATARWATSGEIARARKKALPAVRSPAYNNAAYYIVEPINSPSKGSPVLDAVRSPIVIPAINTGMLVVGASGSGKTANVIDPALKSAIDQGFSIILFDFKFGSGGQSEGVLPHALKNGYQSRIFAPGFECSHVCNVLDRLKDENDQAAANEVVRTLLANTREQGARVDPFFDTGAISIITGFFMLAKSIARIEGNPNLANLLMVSQLLGTKHIAQRLIANRESIEPWSYKALATLLGTASDDGSANVTSGGLIASAANILAPLTLPNLLPALVGNSSFPCFDNSDPLKVEGRQIVTFGVDLNYRQSVIPVIATMLQQVISANLVSKRQTPLVICLDEFPTLVHFPYILNVLNEARSYGASVIIGIQYLGQLEKAYGRDLAKGFEAACATKFWFRPGDADTAKHLSNKFGQEEIQLDSKSRNYNPKGGTGRSVAEQLHRKALIEPQDINQLPIGKCIAEIPSVGTNASGVPFLHQFRYNYPQAERKNTFAWMLKCLADYNNKNTVDYAALIREYDGIIERLFPLAPGFSNSKKSGDRLLDGNALADLAAAFDIEVEVDRSKEYKIPKDMFLGGSLEATEEELLNMLKYNDLIPAGKHHGQKNK